MTPLLLPSPAILDHSFPRSEAELYIVAAALGELELITEKNAAHIVMTPILGQLVESFDWLTVSEKPVLLEIYRLLNQWFLQSHDALHVIRRFPEEPYKPHPIPSCVSGDGLAEFWRDEVGKLLLIHDQSSEGAEFYIGIPCAHAFSGLGKSHYMDDEQGRRFPIIGPTELGALSDGFRWSLPSGVHSWSVSFANARKNLFSIGASEIVSPSGGSHYRVKFPGARCWTLDPNDDPIPDTYLDQLTKITPYPLNVIRYALNTGKLPERIFRLAEYVY